MKKIFTFLYLLLSCMAAVAQVGINTDNSSPNSSAMLDVKSTTKGVLIPRMTYDQRNTISAPAEGLMVFCTNCVPNGALTFYSNGAWRLLSICGTPSTSAGTHVVIPGQITWQWTAVAGAIGYKWNTTQNYSTAIDMGTASSKIETGISCGITYTRYVWVYNDCGISPPLTLTQSVPASPSSQPTGATQITSQNTITWNWNPLPGATGYKWNTTNNPASAVDMGTSTTKLELGLNCNTAYTRYVWSYNACGISTPGTLIQTTSLCTVCGDSVTVIHLVSGGTAPVDKTVTYGTVTNIPGEQAKCWITRNLGATKQADTVWEHSEAAAGWYFQFNRTQGYQYINSRIPASTWINSISETSDWIADNDPCSNELGNGWRIPTYLEYYNIFFTGYWYNSWNGPFQSALKFHAAGYIDHSTGVLSLRGVSGSYWSSTAYDNNAAYAMGFYFEGGNIGTGYKADASSVRCIRDF